MQRPAEQQGSLPVPGPLGRVGRFLLGLAAGAVFVLVLLARLESPPGERSPAPLFLIAAALAVYMLPDVTAMTFGRRWGRTPLVAGLGLAAILGLVAYDRFYAPPLAWYLFLLVEVVFGLLALSLFLAALFAVPGREMRAVPYVIGQIRRQPVTEFT